MTKDREYQNYVNTRDKVLKEIDEIRLQLSRKLRRMTKQAQLAYFGNDLVQNRRRKLSSSS